MDSNQHSPGYEPSILPLKYLAIIFCLVLRERFELSILSALVSKTRVYTVPPPEHGFISFCDTSNAYDKHKQYHDY